MKRLLMPFLLPLLLLIGCAKAPITGRTQIMMVTPQQEKAMGFQAEKEILKKEKLSTDQALIARVRRIGMRIAKATELNLDWKFYVIEKPDVANAFCLANGHVFIYTGILKYTDNDAQLATVMAHEIGHAIAHHVAEQVSMAMVTNIAATAAAIAIEHNVKSSTEEAAYMAALGLGANMGIVLPYSRMLESEADHIGLMLMAKACYDPRESIKFWKKFAKKGKEPIVYFSTHPSSAQRIEQLTELMPQAMKIYRQSGCEKSVSAADSPL
ncbi:M48 family metallopeptidase [Hydrogenimonas urashimensis]|uniref:M48 family metallopeptidase n=1 Tax=Hydrogenimonas urashimensis TaxID=2740515 RepID=UPI001915CCD3|nr:M48 family metallopeptidase [Hydrogenimonas urashimensis]